MTDGPRHHQITKDIRHIQADHQYGYEHCCARTQVGEGRQIRHPDVGARDRKRGASDAEVLGITRGWILSRLQAIAIAAEDAGNFGPANRALELLAKLRGDLIKRSEVETQTVSIVLNGVNLDDLK